MATVMKDEKIIGGIGIAAAVAFLVTMLIASIINEEFEWGTGELSQLYPEQVFAIGCVAAGILGAIFGLLITVKKAESKLFIGKVRGVLMVLSGVVLAILGILGLMEGESWVEYLVYLFAALIILSAASDMFCNWIADQKIIMVFTLLFTLMMALTGILWLTGNENHILGFLFVLIILVWVLMTAAMRFAPIEEAAPEAAKKNKKEKGKESEAKKKNAPAPRPYPANKEEPPVQKKAATEKTVYREKPRKIEPSKKEEPKKEVPPPVQKKEEPKKEVPPAQKKEPPKKEEPEVKKELPKLKIMSSREAAAARETARKKEEPAEGPAKEETVPEPAPAVVSAAEPAAEPVKEEIVPEPAPAVVSAAEPAAEPVEEIVPEAVTEPEEAEPDTEEEPEEYDESDIAEDTPDALLRRATWNKGLRCRRDYGEHRIPIAYVKAKVAVYLDAETGDTSADEKLRADGWTVLHYSVSGITDGKDQAEEINKAVKENLKAERAAKKKKSSKK